MPLVILSHGLGGSYSSRMEEAERYAGHGIAAYCIEFRGGGGSRSDGDTTRMSVMTEVSDLEAALEASKSWDFVDTDRIVLQGSSQGGIVSAILAARHPDDVAGLILYYPAFMFSDDLQSRFGSLENVPEKYHYLYVEAGRVFAEDMWDYDVYDEIGHFTKPVLLIHGDADSVVPVSYSEKASQVYDKAEFHVISGAGHGFYGSESEQAMDLCLSFLLRNGIVSANSALPESVRMTFDDGTTAYINNLQDNASTRAFLAMLPANITLSDWDGREYWCSEKLPYDEASVQHTYAVGEFTYWCGGWITAYYDTNEDTVIEAGSVVIGTMDNVAVQQFSQASGASMTIKFEAVI